ncbi:aminotransferase class IV [Saccharomonospora saliphila]|uniref:aminotransferase class IV n=1 Tax=Saccharomonospora saliphila TaxID=369829 RepID=UPI00039A263C|nr:aminotransferase class IV [Saccharomonospora saliphila]
MGHEAGVSPVRAYLNGEPATAERLAAAAVAGYGHFTTMRVADGRVRGLGSHLDRLTHGNRVVFDADLDTGFVRECLRRAVPGSGDVVARVTVVGSPVAVPAEPDVLVTVRESAPAETPVRLRSTRYERPLPEVKHVGTFAQHLHARRARQAGHDDALFVTGDGLVTETSVRTIGFVEHGTVVWPRGPLLAGVTQHVLDEGLRRAGVPTTHRAVTLDEVPGCDAAFVCNAGEPVRPVAAVDGTPLPDAGSWTETLRRAYASIPSDPL